jgi:predicted alpha/beta hydrolase family esterase
LTRGDHTTALILLPGCLLQPHQNETVAKAIQREFDGQCWVVVPKLPLDMANPWSVTRAVRRSITALRAAGYPRDRPVYVGGHSLGGIFLPNLLDEPDNDLVDQIAGLVQLGSFVSREQKRKQKKQQRDGIIATNKSAFDRTPRLVLNGDLDGLIRVARIAEDFYNHVVLAGDTERDRLHHAVVLVRGMVRYDG